MVDTFKNLHELRTYFKTEKDCVEYLIQQRWGGNVTCPHCGAGNPYKTVTRSRKPELKGTFDYRCREKSCFKNFSPITGTIFENTKIPLKKWFEAMYTITAHKKGISSLQLSRDLGFTQTTAWFVLHRVREMLKTELPEHEISVYEADETFIGGKNKNRHADKKILESQGRSVKDKTPVGGMLRRTTGTVHLAVLKDTKASSLKPFIEEAVKKGSIVITDEWLGYNTVKQDYHHVVINHKNGEYVRGAFHTNGIESFWAVLKRGLYGIYHSTSKKHLHRYTDEFSYRFNTRKITDADRFSNTLANVGRARLTYKELIK